MAHLQLVRPPPPVSHNDAEDERNPRDASVPRWWTNLVVITLRCGKWCPPLWPIWMALFLWRGVDVHRALEGLRKHLRWDGRGTAEGFCFPAAFIEAERRLRGDACFARDAETALFNGRTRIFGLAATLDDELRGEGYAPILRHYRWALFGGRHPFPDSVVAPWPAQLTRQPWWILVTRSVNSPPIATLDRALGRLLQWMITSGFHGIDWLTS